MRHKPRDSVSAAFGSQRHSRVAVFDPNYVSRAFRDAVAAAKLQHIPLHGLRYTHASHVVDAGVAISVVSKPLGHAISNITLGVYTHQLRDSQAKAACVVADLVQQAAN